MPPAGYGSRINPLGEYSALVASGALDFEDAVALVAKWCLYGRGCTCRLWERWLPFLLRLRKLGETASKVGVESNSANWLPPQAKLLSNRGKVVDYAVELCVKRGSKRGLIPLNVSGPFHTALLEPASQ